MLFCYDVRMRLRRRRRNIDLTPEQDATKAAMDRAELWLRIVSGGIADTLKDDDCGCTTRELRSVIDVVNTELAEAIVNLENAQAAHEKAMDD